MGIEDMIAEATADHIVKSTSYFMDCVVGYPSYRVSDPHVRVPLVLTAVDLEVVRWELVLEVDLVS